MTDMVDDYRAAARSSQPTLQRLRLQIKARMATIDAETDLGERVSHFLGSVSHEPQGFQRFGLRSIRLDRGVQIFRPVRGNATDNRRAHANPPCCKPF
ncbi:hypothetical protein ACFY3O_33145 [Streptomyces sp. NPDC001046]|uniref:hypothetical protein n=1 Tax=Streptomyces sp. NPDC001046 TaxID=3364543 RepID=UPI0036B4A0EB